MRTLRLSLTGTVIVLLLGCLPALAQESEDGAVMVTGAQSCDDDGCTFTASDPRVAGTGTWSLPVPPVSTADGTPVYMWDEITIEGPDGTWSGHHYVVADEMGTAHVFMVLSGTGAYEGWQYVATATDTPPHGTHDLVGVLFEGPVPPIGPVAPAAAE